MSSDAEMGRAWDAYAAAMQQAAAATQALRDTLAALAALTPGS